MGRREAAPSHSAPDFPPPPPTQSAFAFVGRRSRPGFLTAPKGRRRHFDSRLRPAGTYILCLKRSAYQIQIVEENIAQPRVSQFKFPPCSFLLRDDDDEEEEEAVTATTTCGVRLLEKAAPPPPWKITTFHLVIGQRWARNSKENLTLYGNGCSLFSVDALLIILTLGLKFTS